MHCREPAREQGRTTQSRTARALSHLSLPTASSPSSPSSSRAAPAHSPALMYVSSSTLGLPPAACAPYALEFASGSLHPSGDEEEVNLMLVAEWARAQGHTRSAKQRHTAAAGEHYLAPDTCEEEEISRYHSSTSQSHSRSRTRSVASVSVSASAAGQHRRDGAQSPKSSSLQRKRGRSHSRQADRQQDAAAAAAASSASAAASSLAVPAAVSSSSKSARTSISRCAGGSVAVTPVSVCESPRPLASPAVAAPAVVTVASLMAAHPSVRVRGGTGEVASEAVSAPDCDMGEEEDEEEQLQVRFHDEMSQSDERYERSPQTVHHSGHHTAITQTLVQRLVASLPHFLALVQPFLDHLSCTAVAMQTCRSWRDSLLSAPVWRGSTWAPARPRLAAQATPGYGGHRMMVGGGDACAVLSNLNQTYGVGVEHSRWIVPPLPPHTFLLSRVQHIDLNADPSLMAAVGRAALAAHMWSDHHLVLLPYFSSLLTLDLSYIGAMEGGGNTTGGMSMSGGGGIGMSGANNSTGSSTLSTAGGAPPRLSGVILGRIALLPQLHTLLLNHCSWVDDEAIACLRNKYHCKLAMTPGEAPPPPPEVPAAAAPTPASPSHAELGALSCFLTAAAPAPFTFLPPLASLPSLTSLSLDFCPRLSPKGLAYLLSAGGTPNLTELSLSNSGQAVSSVSTTALLEHQSHSLRKLHLSWCGGMGRAASLSSASATLKPLASLPHLIHLDLRGWAELREQTIDIMCAPATALTTSTAAAAAAAASATSASVASSMPRAHLPLQSLNLRGCSSLGSKGLLHLSRLASTLLELDVSDCRIVCDATLRMLGYSLHALQRLLMWNVPLVTDQGIEALMCGGQSMQACWELARAHQRQAVRALGPMALVATHSTETAATSASLPPVSSPALPCLLHSLRTLKLSSAPLLTDRVAATLRCATALEELELMDVPGLGDRAVELLCGADQQLSHSYPAGALRRTLHSLQLSRLGPHLTSSCGTHLRHLSALRSLDLSWNDAVGDDMIASMFDQAHTAADAAALQTGAAPSTSTADALTLGGPTSLRHLNLARCAITRRGLQLLSAHPLSSLDVRYCANLTTAAVDSFHRAAARTSARAARLNPHLTPQPPCLVEHTCAPAFDGSDDVDPDGDTIGEGEGDREGDDESAVGSMPFRQLAVGGSGASVRPNGHSHTAGWDTHNQAMSGAAYATPVTANLVSAAPQLPICPPIAADDASPPPRPLLSGCGHSQSGGFSFDSLDDVVGGAGTFRVECQVVENEDDDDDDDEGDDDDFDDEDDSGDGGGGGGGTGADGSSDVSDESMISHPANAPTFTEEEDEQGEIWAVHQAN